MTEEQIKGFVVRKEGIMNANRAAMRVVFDHITATSMERHDKWSKGQGLNCWTILEWAGAMAGEAGEAANVAKKIRRIEQDFIHSSDPGSAIGSAALTPGDIETLRSKLGQELADTFLYMVLVAAKGGVDLSSMICSTFNAKSIEYNFPERL